MNGKVSEKIFKYNLDQKEFIELKQLSLIRKKYDFGFTEVDDGVVILFGGKDELRFPLAEIELIDFNTNTSRIIGKMAQPKFSLFALKLNTYFPINNEVKETNESDMMRESFNSPKLYNDENVLKNDCSHVSFDISGLESRISLSSPNGRESLDNLASEFSCEKPNKVKFDLEDSKEVDLMATENHSIQKNKKPRY